MDISAQSTAFISDTDTDFEAYEEGYYTMNHTEAHVLELDVA